MGRHSTGVRRTMGAELAAYYGMYVGRAARCVDEATREMSSGACGGRAARATSASGGAGAIWRVWQRDASGQTATRADDGAAVVQAVVVVHARWATQAEAAGEPVGQVLHEIPRMPLVRVAGEGVEGPAQQRRRRESA